MKVDTTVINDKGTREALGKQVLLSVEDMDITYGKGAAAIRGISFTISPGEVLAIVGESGSGKTSIIRALLGCISGDGQIAKGTITFDGTDITALTNEEWRRYRGCSISMIFQD